MGCPCLRSRGRARGNLMANSLGETRGSRILAFSLVEITVALAIIATGLIAVVGLIPVGLEASRQSAEHTVTAIILEDVHNRLQGHPLKTGPLETFRDIPGLVRPGSPFFYDDLGVYLPGETRGGAAITPEERLRRNYRADVRIVPVRRGGNADLETKLADAPGLLAVVIEISWPLHPLTGEPMGAENPKTSVSYYITSLTGPEWERIDSDFKHKIEY